jgi:hypothetical protein
MNALRYRRYTASPLAQRIHDSESYTDLQYVVSLLHVYDSLYELPYITQLQTLTSLQVSCTDSIICGDKLKGIAIQYYRHVRNT